MIIRANNGNSPTYPKRTLSFSYGDFSRNNGGSCKECSIYEVEYGFDNQLIDFSFTYKDGLYVGNDTIIRTTQVTSALENSTYTYYLFGCNQKGNVWRR